MQDISNWAVLIGNITVIVTALSGILEFKLRGLKDNQRLLYRYQICNFAGDLHNEIPKTREEFQAIFEMYDRYELLIEKLKLKNHYIDSEMHYIKEQYKLLK